MSAPFRQFRGVDCFVSFSHLSRCGVTLMKYSHHMRRNTLGKGLNSHRMTQQSSLDGAEKPQGRSAMVTLSKRSLRLPFRENENISNHDQSATSIPASHHVFKRSMPPFKALKHAGCLLLDLTIEHYLYTSLGMVGSTACGPWTRSHCTTNAVTHILLFDLQIAHLHRQGRRRSFSPKWQPHEHVPGPSVGMMYTRGRRGDG